MAQAMLAETKLRLIFEVGLNEKREPIFKTKTLNVKKDATADQLNQAAQALSILCKDTLSGVERNDNLEIIG
jgi:hypothetical protein